MIPEQFADITLGALCRRVYAMSINFNC